MAHVTGISPVLLVADLDRSVEFFRERLGWDCELFGDPPNFATATRDGETILLSLAPSAERVVPNWRVVEKMWDVYVRVDDVEAVYLELQGRAAKIDYGLYDAPHGFREFGVQDPDGHDIAFGQPIQEP